MKNVNVVILGATGAVGVEFRKILLERKFPIGKIKFLGNSTVGQTIEFGGRSVTVEAAREDSFAGYQLGLFSAGATISKQVARAAAAAGCVVVDNSSAWRMEKDIPLVVPEVNPNDVDWHPGIIANPNCSTIQMVVALKPLHDAARIKRIVVSTYQAVSGTGLKAVDELTIQTRDIMAGKPISQRKVYPHQIAFNALPQIDVFLENGYTKEEMKMVNETKKIMGDDAIQVTATTVRVPVFYGHSESVNIETEKKLSAQAVRELLAGAPGVTVVDDPANGRYPLALDAAGKDDVFVGRIREDESIPNGINMWIVSDNIRKGAALNAVQIAELLMKKNII
ncbi:MAG TPA: aspartate-semialdehyde dehydrogenase [Spirochaetota bacterium]|mgnify:CR=1 FL=1|nr:aspartate-semialdehyde dehydrogenase [Spirochaetota bacterium]HNT11950.1 aspartate-semialdehyde dehydrogenase [Spirochaetota bacterium]HNV48741.1 aspartate-semialdehyde dehydrogenase [Spirochaetota bacterium]HOS41733.1 aspartate-semialdehyde dehydrogenase [Spirochaetota bacterium]